MAKVDTELKEDMRKNLEDRLEYIDWVVEQIKKDHKAWLKNQVEWLRKSHEALIRLLEKNPEIKKQIIEELKS